MRQHAAVVVLGRDLLGHKIEQSDAGHATWTAHNHIETLCTEGLDGGNGRIDVEHGVKILRNYQISTRLFLGTKSLSPFLIPNALYQASIWGSAPFTRQRAGAWGSVFT